MEFGDTIDLKKRDARRGFPRIQYIALKRGSPRFLDRQLGEYQDLW
jgi:hypothetical protein